MLLQNKSKQVGFTLVELIVVIIILGILSAVALPKFMSVTTKANKAAVDGVTGGFTAGVALFHAQWVANGLTSASDNVVGFGDGTVDANATGYPSDTAGANTVATDAHCVAIWNGIMQNPPSVVAAGSTAADYTATRTGTNCNYTYNGDTDGRSILYASVTGAVTKTNP